jgi:hypothetical protein
MNPADVLSFRLRGTSQGQRYRHGQGPEPKQKQRQREGYELGQVGRRDGMRLSKARDKGQDTETDRDKERDSGSPMTAPGVCLASLVLCTPSLSLSLSLSSFNDLEFVLPPTCSLLLFTEFVRFCAR